MKFSQNSLGHYTINSSAGSVGTAAAVCRWSHDAYSASCPGFQSCHRFVSCIHKLLSLSIQILYYNIQEEISDEHIHSMMYSCIPAYDILGTGWWCQFLIYFPFFFTALRATTTKKKVPKFSKSKLDISVQLPS